MKIKTRELENTALDWAVAKCEGVALVDGCIFTKDPADEQVLYSPSTNWVQGGPIIEREWICVNSWPNESDNDARWLATNWETPKTCQCWGPTPLIAAMRCYVASKLGDEVEISGIVGEEAKQKEKRK